MSQQKLASAAGVSMSTISALERSDRLPQYLVACAITDALDVDLLAVFPRLTQYKATVEDVPLRVLRLERGISQRQLARAAGLTSGIVQRAECGTRVSPTSLRALANFFGVPESVIQDPRQDPVPA